MKDIKTTGISVKSVLGKINSNKYNFDLAIQRRAGIWKTPEKSLFIDTILREYPVYPALLNKHSDTQKVDVVDFKQRFNKPMHIIWTAIRQLRNIDPVRCLRLQAGQHM